MADGDGRYVLNMAEQIFALPPDTPPIDPAALADLLARRAALYDKDREEHYNLISALHKSLRGSDPDAALYWLRACWTAARTRATSPAAWCASPPRTSAWPTRTR